MNAEGDACTGQARCSAVTNDAHRLVLSQELLRYFNNLTYAVVFRCTVADGIPPVGAGKRVGTVHSMVAGKAKVRIIVVAINVCGSTTNLSLIHISEPTRPY